MNAVKLVIGKVYGDEARQLLEFIIENGFVAEETLSNDTGIKSNEGRRILQRMSDEALVIPDKLRTENGVLHVWKLNEPALKTFLMNRLKKTKENLELLLKYSQENSIYECPRCGRLFTLSNIYAMDFTCPHDGEVLVEVDGQKYSRVIEALLRRINAIINQLERVGVVKTSI